MAGGNFAQGFAQSFAITKYNTDQHSDVTGVFSHAFNERQHPDDGLRGESQNEINPSEQGVEGYGSFGLQGAAHIGIAGGSYSVNSYIGQDGNICVASTACVRLGPGIMVQGGVTTGVGVTNGGVENVQGFSGGIGGDIGIPGAMAGGALTVGGTSAGGVKGHVGTGAGISVGVDICYTSECW